MYVILGGTRFVGEGSVCVKWILGFLCFGLGSLVVGRCPEFIDVVGSFSSVLFFNAVEVVVRCCGLVDWLEEIQGFDDRFGVEVE